MERLVHTELKCTNVACQAMSDKNNNNDLFKLECVFSKLNNDVATQASTPLNYNYIHIKT